MSSEDRKTEESDPKGEVDPRGTESRKKNGSKDDLPSTPAADHGAIVADSSSGVNQVAVGSGVEVQKVVMDSKGVHKIVVDHQGLQKLVVSDDVKLKQVVADKDGRLKRVVFGKKSGHCRRSPRKSRHGKKSPRKSRPGKQY